MFYKENRMTTKIAFLGLGAMGSRIAKNLLERGYDLTVYNRDQKKCEELVNLGAKMASTPEAASKGNEIVFCMVTNDEASQDIWFNPQYGAIRGLSNDAVAIDLSTLSLDWTKELHQKMTEENKLFLEAPVVGSRPQAEGRQLAFLVAGENQTFKRVEGVLQKLGSKVLFLAGAGNGAIWKLVINSLFGIQTAAFAEMTRTLQVAGFSNEKILKILPEIPITSPIIKVMLDLMVGEKHLPLFPIDLVEKDLGYATKLLGELKIESPMLHAGKSVFQKAQEQGFGEDNISSIIRVYKEKNN